MSLNCYSSFCQGKASAAKQAKQRPFKSSESEEDGLDDDESSEEDAPLPGELDDEESEGVAENLSESESDEGDEEESAEEDEEDPSDSEEAVVPGHVADGLKGRQQPATGSTLKGSNNVRQHELPTQRGKFHDVGPHSTCGIHMSEVQQPQTYRQLCTLSRL